MVSPVLSPEALRARLGATMASARRRVLDILKPHRLNQRFQSDLLVQLMHHQPSTRRVPVAQIDAFMRMKRPPHNNVCLFAVLSTGRTADVSWLRSVRNLYGRHDEEAEATRRVISAFRNEIHMSSPKMRDARATFSVGPCADCGKRRKLAIDHAGTPFAQILDGFLIASRADWAAFVDAGSVGAAPPPFVPSTCIGSIALRWYNGAHILADRVLARLWCDWHEERAELVGLCKPCNSSKGSGGYRYSFSQGGHTGGGAANDTDVTAEDVGGRARGGARRSARRAPAEAARAARPTIMKAARKRTRPELKGAAATSRKRARN